MKIFGWSLVCMLGVLGGANSVLAAPKLTIDNTAFKYDGDTLFFSGMNLAWIDYNSDVGDGVLNENKWRKAVEDTRAAGGNVIRWWLFNNMSQSPTIDQTEHVVSGLKTNTIANMKKALDIAEEYGVMVSMCLFSHNLMESENWGLYNGKVDIIANRKLMGPEGTEAFIQKALLPVLQGVGNHNALMTWEIFNEAEGMTTEGNGWTKQKIAKDSVLAFANKVAGAIHDFSDTSTTMGGGKLLVSTGCVRADYLPWWSDASLVAAGKKSNGTMDFMQLHYYPFYQATGGSPFHKTYAEMQAAYPFGNKPLVVGEFPAQGWNSSTITATGKSYQSSNTTTEQCYRYPFEHGYAGALAWDYAGFTDEFSSTVVHNFDDAAVGMKALWATDSGYIKIKDYTPAVTAGNGVMQVTYSNVGGKTGASLEYLSPVADLSARTKVSFSVRSKGATAPMTVRLVAKSHNGADWYWSEGAECTVPASGAWATCSYDLTNMASGDKVYTSVVYSFLIQTFTAGFTGVIQVDNLVAGSASIVNFDTQYDLFGAASGMTGGEAITKIETVYINDGPSAVLASYGSASTLGYADGRLSLLSPASSFAVVEIFDIAGNRVRVLHQGRLDAGVHQFSLGGLSAGLYHARVQGSAYRASVSFVVQN